jgi:uncharacterized protein YndB with AHSA1/START domain
MKFDVEGHLGAVMRTVSSVEIEGKPGRAVTLGRGYEATVADVWDALTHTERLSRWFSPVSGDLRQGGRYQLEGNAGGTITVCQPPTHLMLTWEFGGDISWVEVVLTAEEAGRSRLKLTHTALLSDHWAQYGPGATGIGWELGLLGLALHLAHPNQPKIDETAFATSPRGKAFTIGSGEGWGRAAIDAGEDRESALAAAKRTIAFYTGTTNESQ